MSAAEVQDELGAGEAVLPAHHVVALLAFLKFGEVSVEDLRAAFQDRKVEGEQSPHVATEAFVAEGVDRQCFGLFAAVAHVLCLSLEFSFDAAEVQGRFEAGFDFDEERDVAAEGDEVDAE